MYRAIKPIHSHAHGKTFAAGAQITEREFPPHAIRAMLQDGVLEDMSAPVPETEPEVPTATGTSAAPEDEAGSDVPDWLAMVEDEDTEDEPGQKSAPQKKRGRYG